MEQNTGMAAVPLEGALEVDAADVYRRVLESKAGGSPGKGAVGTPPPPLAGFLVERSAGGSGASAARLGPQVGDPCHGWVLAYDPVSGMPFFFNAATRTSQWQFPEALAPDPAGAATSVRRAARSFHIPLLQCATTPEVSTDGVWVAQLDGASGNLVYYNVVTRATTLDEPEGVEFVPLQLPSPGPGDAGDADLAPTREGDGPGGGAGSGGGAGAGKSGKGAGKAGSDAATDSAAGGNASTSGGRPRSSSREFPTAPKKGVPRRASITIALPPTLVSAEEALGTPKPDEDEEFEQPEKAAPESKPRRATVHTAREAADALSFLRGKYGEWPPRKTATVDSVEEDVRTGAVRRSSMSAISYFDSATLASLKQRAAARVIEASPKSAETASSASSEKGAESTV